MDINYYFNADDPLRPFTHSLPANEGTLPPANAVRVEPLRREGFWPCWDGQAWVQAQDHRGAVGYDTATGSEVRIESLGPWPVHLVWTPKRGTMK